jgi:ribosomal protein S18 acetylase RimI-like enzyme
MDIRTLGPSEYDDAIELWHATGLTRPWNDPRADIERAASGPSSVVLGGLVDGELVATVMTGHDGHRGWVYYLAVQPARQGHGLGAQMMHAAEAWLSAACVGKVQLMVRSDNESASGFYSHIGYELSEVQVYAKWLTRSPGPCLPSSDYSGQVQRCT